MSNLEPTDVGPAVGGDRAISEADRHHVVTLLTAAHAEGRLSATERDRRTAETRQALVFDDLVPLTRDLVTEAGPQPVNDAERPSSSDSEQIVAFFSGVERKGRWSVRPHLGISAVFGGVDLNMTEAVFEAKEITVDVFCLFGGVDLKVPPGTEVDNHLVAAFGGCTNKVGPPSPGGPRVIVKGFAGFGGVEIRHPKANKRRRPRATA